MRAVDVVRKVAPKAKPEYIAAFEAGDALLKKHEINTPERLSHFLAQVLHETGGLTILWESGAYSAERLIEIFGEGNHTAGITEFEAQQLARNGPAIFERVYGLGNPKKARELGNTRPGDGWRFRGGGMMQTTGGYNYKAMGERCGVDFYNHPELIVSAEHALKPALAEWTSGGLNAFADEDDLLSISRKINLGNVNSKRTPNGWADRQFWYRKASSVIGKVDFKTDNVPPPPDIPKPEPQAQSDGWLSKFLKRLRG
jgi:putative chitinase